MHLWIDTQAKLAYFQCPQSGQDQGYLPRLFCYDNFRTLSNLGGKRSQGWGGDTMTERAEASAEMEELTIITRPNCSLSAAGRLLLFCVILLFSSAIAVGFALVGAWFILPFSGLEVLALGWALYYIGCHVDDYESIVISGDRMVIERRSYKTVHKVEFQRYWSQVVVVPATMLGKCRVWVRSRGQEVELGRFVDDDARMALACRLKERTGAGYRV